MTLGGQTPRHAVASSRDAVASLISEMESNDPGLRRVGRCAFDYNVLRGHVGIDEHPGDDSPDYRATREHAQGQRTSSTSANS